MTGSHHGEHSRRDVSVSPVIAVGLAVNSISITAGSLSPAIAAERPGPHGVKPGQLATQAGVTILFPTVQRAVAGAEFIGL